MRTPVRWLSCCQTSQPKGCHAANRPSRRPRRPRPRAGCARLDVAGRRARPPDLSFRSVESVRRWPAPRDRGGRRSRSGRPCARGGDRDVRRHRAFVGKIGHGHDRRRVRRDAHASRLDPRRAGLVRRRRSECRNGRPQHRRGHRRAVRPPRGKDCEPGSGVPRSPDAPAAASRGRGSTGRAAGRDAAGSVTTRSDSGRSAADGSDSDASNTGRCARASACARPGHGDRRRGRRDEPHRQLGRREWRPARDQGRRNGPPDAIQRRSSRVGAGRIAAERITAERVTAERVTARRIASERCLPARPCCSASTLGRVTSGRISSSTAGHAQHDDRRAAGTFCCRRRRHGVPAARGGRRDRSGPWSLRDARARGHRPFVGSDSHA